MKGETISKISSVHIKEIYIEWFGNEGHQCFELSWILKLQSEMSTLCTSSGMKDIKNKKRIKESFL